MSAEPLIVVIPHSLGKAELIRRLKPGLATAAQSFPMISVEDERWTGDVMTFRVKALGQVASGTIEAAEKHVRLEVSLPFFIAKFAEKIRAVVSSRGALLLENKSK